MSASLSALQRQRALSLLYLAALFWPAAQEVAPLGHSAVLDPQGHFLVHWGRQGDRITFLLEVQTLGYVGFGLSTTGAMASADLVIGGVRQDGKPYLQVRAQKGLRASASAQIHRTPSGEATMMAVSFTCSLKLPILHGLH
ncbi:hypothetical protein NDU88_007357 [Pleurodeles waltl]|uniref:DOMON domain-containing protein n=1 Tax=Pleurodeles waltl TaxID=8319 RepID=A0AAV7RQR9_PLEWA|nr:hypothetical protein NDU88_007357 [Pleurodeles waltl]